STAASAATPSAARPRIILCMSPPPVQKDSSSGQRTSPTRQVQCLQIAGKEGIGALRGVGGERRRWQPNDIPSGLNVSETGVVLFEPAEFGQFAGDRGNEKNKRTRERGKNAAGTNPIRELFIVRGAAIITLLLRLAE